MFDNGSETTRSAGVFGTAIDAIEASRNMFAKRNQKKADRAHRFQHVGGFLSDDAITHYCSTNGIKNNPIERRDMKACK